MLGYTISVFDFCEIQYLLMGITLFLERFHKCFFYVEFLVHMGFEDRNVSVACGSELSHED